MEPEQTITEGLATIKTQGHVFYNPVQEFNRDLSLSVLSVFAEDYESKTKTKDSINITIDKTPSKETGISYDNGITILEALSATGLRSIRYAKEIPGVKKIVANDISKKAVENITSNIKLNSVESIVETSHSDAT